VSRLPIPTEDEECIRFAEWLRLNHIKFGHVNNEMFTTSWKQKKRQLLMGSAKGIPDYLVVLRPNQTVDGAGKLIFVEMKRTKGGVVSKDQEEWLSALNDANQSIAVCKGATKACAYVMGFMKQKSVN